MDVSWRRGREVVTAGFFGLVFISGVAPSFSSIRGPTCGPPKPGAKIVSGLSTATSWPRNGVNVQAEAPVTPAFAASLAGGFLCAAMMRGNQRQKTRRRRSRCGVRRGVAVPRRAEADDGAGNDEEGSSILSKMQDEEEALEAEAQEVEEKMKEEFDNVAEEASDFIDEADENLSKGSDVQRRMAAQVSYELYPSATYVMDVAKTNAIRNWTKDGPGGSDKKCREAKIATITEEIRYRVMMIRTFPNDLIKRRELVSLIATRKKLMDRLSWSDLDSYLRIRDELKIRHVYRVEALIPRLKQYRCLQNFRQKKVGVRKAQKLLTLQKVLTRRIGRAKAQGKPWVEIQNLRLRLKGERRWVQAHEEALYMVKGQACPDVTGGLISP